MRAELFAPAFTLTLFLAVDASAFCRTRTVPAPTDFDPSQGCFAEGSPLFYPSQCLPYRLTTRESTKVPNVALSDALARAFGEWTQPNAHCAPGISTVELAPADRDVIAAYTMGQRGDNIVGFVAPWPHTVVGETLALPTLTYNFDTGEIYDVDLEINDEVIWSATGTPAADSFDLLSVLTHEAGHAFGIAHSSDPDATMFPSYPPGAIAFRTLEDDDARAICDVYPTRFARSAGTGLVPATPCELAPGAAGDDGCGDPEITNGCAAAPGSARGGAGWALAVAAAIASVIAARRTRA